MGPLPLFRRTPAFTLLEVVLTVGIVALVGALAVPLYGTYRLLSDLNLATDQVVEALHRAKLLSQVGEGDASWGFSPPLGILYRGSDYGARDAAFDESYPVPLTITVTGLGDVSFSRLEGEPSATGAIVLTARNGAERIVYVLGGPQGILYDPSGKLAICHRPPENPDAAHTIGIPEAAWPAHAAHGDTIGPCPQ